MAQSFVQDGQNICCSLKHWIQLLEVIRNFGGCEGGSGSVTHLPTAVRCYVKV